MAWTVDDGVDADAIRAYTEFASRSGTRLTYFINGCYRGWRDHADLIRPLVSSGQIQIANHTYSHWSLTDMSDGDIVNELLANHEFIQTTYGVDSRPYYRPPYGFRDERTDAAAASIGYTSPVLWYGVLDDPDPNRIPVLADYWFAPERIVLGHFTPEVIPALDQLGAILAAKGLRSVTLNDIWAPA